MAAPAQEAAAPVEETVEPAAAPVGQALEPAVAPVLTSAHEMVDPVIAPVQETIEPVVTPVQETVAPVLKPVEETVGPVRDMVEPTVMPTPGQNASPSPALIQEPAGPVTTPARESAKRVAIPAAVVEPTRVAAGAMPAREPEALAFEGESVRQQALSALPSATEVESVQRTVLPVDVTVAEIASPDRGFVSVESETSQGRTDQILISRHAEPLVAGPSPVKVSGLAAALGAALSGSEGGTNVSGQSPQQLPSPALPPAGSLSGGSGSGGYAGAGALVSFFVLLWAGKLLLTPSRHGRALGQLRFGGHVRSIGSSDLNAGLLQEVDRCRSAQTHHLGEPGEGYASTLVCLDCQLDQGSRAPERLRTRLGLLLPVLLRIVAQPTIERPHAADVLQALVFRPTHEAQAHEM